MHNPEHKMPAGQILPKVTSIQFELTPADNQRLVNLCGPINRNLHQIEEFYDVKINCRGNQFEIGGEGRRLKVVKSAIQTLYNVAGHEDLSAARTDKLK